MDLSALLASPGRKLALILGELLLLAILLGWLFWSRASLKTDLAQAEANAATLQSANRAKAKALEGLRSYAKLSDKALEQRDVALRNISAQREALRQQTDEVMRNDQNARAWADMPLPPAVRQLLR